MEFIYVCSLVGNDVFHGYCIIGYISTMRDIDRIRKQTKDKYGIEFEKLSSIFKNNGYFCFTNITDNRDISLIIERTYPI